ncbi:MAG: (d)CMP kinase [Candidatus Omnitrophica bacterium]|nr:(d)CMP kinase [Candidatus Omnitrophota bacterium]
MIVSIDGPVGVGKTSVAKAVAQHLGLLHIDTGSMYRALAWKCLEQDLDPDDPQAMATLAEETEVLLQNSPEGPKVFCDDHDVTDEIRSPEVTSVVSQVSAHEGLRHHVVEQQRKLGDQGSVIMEGRDIGSVVFPSADVKIYLDGSLEARTNRRLKELESKGVPCSFEEIRQTVEDRDREDMNRRVSPLTIPEGAQVIDTSHLTFSQVVDRIVETVRAAIRTKRFAKTHH